MKFTFLKKHFFSIFLVIILLVSFWILNHFLVDQIAYIYNQANIYEKEIQQNNQVTLKKEVLNGNEQDNYIVHLGYFGSFLAGTVGLLVSIITVIMLFITFKLEKDRVKMQRFEDRFFKLIEIHRENVNSMRIYHKQYENQKNKIIIISKSDESREILLAFREVNNNIKKINNIFECKKEREILNGEDQGSKAILSIYREMMSIYDLLDNKLFVLDELSKEEKLGVSFIILFFGFGKRSNNITRTYLNFISKKIDLESLRDFFNKNEVRKKISENAPINFKSVGGHQTRLGHYFRNLFFCVKEVHCNKFLSVTEKKEYMKYLRVQLNTYEQILLLANSLTVLGKDWEEYIVIYRLVKNIPFNMIPLDKFDINSHIINLCNKYEKDIKSFYNISSKNYAKNYFEFSKHDIEYTSRERPTIS